jgi:DNA-binding transcriptional MerR regulator
MKTMWSIQQLAEEVNRWCARHQVVPASGQAGERMSERSIRYYRSLDLVDPPLAGGGQGFEEKHRLQLVAVRLLQAQGLPLNRIRELLFGRTLAELQRIEKQGLAELNETPGAVFQPSGNEQWGVTPLNQEFLLVSRRGRTLPPTLGQRILRLLNSKQVNGRRSRAVTERN